MVLQMVLELPPAEMVHVLSAAETFQAWATGALAIATILGIVVGGVWALWHYVLPGPFTASWELEVAPCPVRRDGSGRYLYVVHFRLWNRSALPYRVTHAEAAVVLPQDGERAEGTVARADEAECPWKQDFEDRRINPGCDVSFWASMTCENLHEFVFVKWRLDCRQRRWFGFGGWSGKKLIGRGRDPVPVDAQSLSLYMNRGEASHD